MYPRALIVFLIVFGCASVCSAQLYQRIQVINPTAAQAALIADLDDDHARSVHGDTVETILISSAVARLKAMGCTVNVVVPDMTRFYRERARADLERMQRENPSSLSKPSIGAEHFALGSLGGFLNNREFELQLKSMLEKYPRLVATPYTIGTTIQGRPIYAVRISARSELDKTTPEVLLTGMHHAREPGSMMSLIYTMWNLLEGYGTDPECTYLLDSRAVYFVPLVNPDGYAHNEELSPDGGGMWRKNMREDGDAGVDINRNYGPQDYWNSAAGGSSEDPMSDSYRGTGPFSEPETRAMRDFVLQHHFSLALNRHTYSNLLIYPFDWKTRFPKDTAYYRRVSSELAAVSGFAPGVAAEAVGYLVRGDADAWIYSYGTPGATTITWTPESGSDYDGFWPMPSRIVPMAESDNAMNKLAIWMATSAPRITAVTRAKDNTGAVVLRVTVTNLGRRQMDTSATVTMLVDAGDPTHVVPMLPPGESSTFDMRVPESIYSAKDARPEIVLNCDYHSVASKYVAQVIVHGVTPIFTDNFDATSANAWMLGGWGQEYPVGRGGVLSDSPGKNYEENGTANIAQTLKPISLKATGISAADLSFDASYVVQARNHIASVEIRRVGSDVWEGLESPLFQIPVDSAELTRTLMRGNHSRWTDYTVNLDRYIGSEFYLRFKLHAPSSPYGFTYNGVLIDSMMVMASTERLIGVDVDDAAVTSAEVSVFPNPFADQLTIRTRTANVNTTFTLFDVLGRTVRSTMGAAAAFETATLPDGFYVASVQSPHSPPVRTPVVLQRAHN